MRGISGPPVRAPISAQVGTRDAVDESRHNAGSHRYRLSRGLDALIRTIGDKVTSVPSERRRHRSRMVRRAVEDQDLQRIVAVLEGHFWQHSLKRIVLPDSHEVRDRTHDSVHTHGHEHVIARDGASGDRSRNEGRYDSALRCNLCKPFRLRDERPQIACSSRLKARDRLIDHLPEASSSKQFASVRSGTEQTRLARRGLFQASEIVRNRKRLTGTVDGGPLHLGRSTSGSIETPSTGNGSGACRTVEMVGRMSMVWTGRSLVIPACCFGSLTRSGTRSTSDQLVGVSARLRSPAGSCTRDPRPRLPARRRRFLPIAAAQACRRARDPRSRPAADDAGSLRRRPTNRRSSCSNVRPAIS